MGVDVEAIRATTDVDGIAARFFSMAEQRALASVAPTDRLAACFACWTRKEAYLKGIGVGVTVELRDVDVSVDAGQPATVAGWSVYQVDVAPGFAATVAVAVAGERLGGWVPPRPILVVPTTFFDVPLMELWMPLMAGASIVVAP